MNTNKDIAGQLKKDIDNTDDSMAKKILDLLEIKQPSLWFGNEILEHENEMLKNEEVDMLPDEEKTLTYEQVKQMYPHWFKE